MAKVGDAPAAQRRDRLGDERMVDGDDGEGIDAGAEVEHGPRPGSSATDRRGTRSRRARARRGWPGSPACEMGGELAIEAVLALEQEKAERRGRRGVAHPLGEQRRP